VVIRLSGHDLACVRGGREVFDRVNFAVAAGEALAVTGRNGAGKTTLLRLIAGLLEPAGGRLELTGGAPEATLPEQAHYLGHRDALKPALSVRENLEFWYAFLGGRDASAASAPSAASALEAVGLDGLAGLPAAYLSAGQRRRLAIARLVAAPRPIWLLDEPTAALDTAGQQRLAELMRAHLAGGGIIVAATHGPLGLENVKELRLEPSASARARSAPSPTEPGLARVPQNVSGEVWGGGSIGEETASPIAQTRTAPASDPSPQGGGEKKSGARP
jgi:heme exporter protein A